MTKYPKLPKQFKRKWVAALRSGKFKQAQKSLYNNGGYCCLGVACVIHAGKKIKPANDDPRNGQLPEEVLSVLRTEGNFRFRREWVGGVLMEMNDHEKWSFKRIAAWIEKTL
jgi:hypothetical protein